MFSNDEIGVLHRAIKAYWPASKQRKMDAPHINRLRTMLSQLVENGGLLLPPEGVPAGPAPPAKELQHKTIAEFMPAMVLMTLNLLRSRPPAWVDAEVALACSVHAVVEIVKTSREGMVNSDKLARIIAASVTQLPGLSPALKEHFERTQLVGLANAQGGDA